MDQSLNVVRIFPHDVRIEEATVDGERQISLVLTDPDAAVEVVALFFLNDLEAALPAIETALANARRRLARH